MASGMNSCAVSPRSMSERNYTMAKTVLVIGGSEFSGRVFSIHASRSGDFDLHVVNRGQFPLGLNRVTEYKCDRRNHWMMGRLVPKITYDALIDFCAYNPGEIKSVIKELGDRIKQYIFISTASVYQQAENGISIKEGDPILPPEQGQKKDAVGDYISNKIELEHELIEACTAAGIKYTILRPTFMYGPFNYAPRESYFIEMIARKHTLPVPVDSTAHFNFVYVVDVARALMQCVGNKDAFNEVFNLSGKESVTYEQLISDFERYNSGPFDIREVTVQEVLDKGIPLPFPLTDDMLYSGEKIAEALEFEYTPFSEGMEKTFKIFYSLFTS